MEKHLGFFNTLQEKVQLVKVGSNAYLIKTGKGQYRGIDYKYDSKALLNAITTDIIKHAGDDVHEYSA